MATVLIAWELGTNLGHLTKLAEIAGRLRNLGVEPVFAVHDTQAAARMLPQRGFRFVAAPTIEYTSQRRPAAMSFADVLLEHGFADSSALHRRLAAWVRLIRTFSPRSVLLDFAPTAALAAMITATPCAAIGTGFDLPPLPFPSLRPWVPCEPAQLAAGTNELIACVEGALHGLGWPGRFTLDGWLRAGPRFLQGLPETDLWGARREVVYLGILPARGFAEAPLWPTGAGDTVTKRALAYLRTSTDPEPLLALLSQCGHYVLCVAPQAGRETAARFCTPRCIVTNEPIDLGNALQTADLMINYGSLATVAQCLLAGIPQLMLPIDTEKALLARRIVSLGAGIGLPPWASQAEFLPRLDKLAGTPDIGRAARSIAARHAAVDWAGRWDRLAGLLAAGG